jgi:uncharacterized membrane protein
MLVSMETQARSIVKAVSYRLLGSSVTGLILYAVTGKGTISLLGSVADMVLKIGAYFVHERIWDRIAFGRTSQAKPPEYEI